MRRGEKEGLKGDDGGGILVHDMVIFPGRDEAETRGGKGEEPRGRRKEMPRDVT